jgi:hypothetical protein
MTARIEAARRQLLAVVEVYKPLHAHITADWSSKFAAGLDELHNAAVEAATSATAAMIDAQRFKEDNWNATARTLGFESVTEALGYLMTERQRAHAEANAAAVAALPPDVPPSAMNGPDGSQACTLRLSIRRAPRCCRSAWAPRTSSRSRRLSRLKSWQRLTRPATSMPATPAHRRARRNASKRCRPMNARRPRPGVFVL